MPAPGRSYRKGISLVEVVSMFDTEEKAEAWWAKQRWPNGLACPHCGSLNATAVAGRKPMPYRCREKQCRKHFSVRTGTVLANSKLPLSKWAIALYLYMTGLKGVSSMKLHRDLGVTQKAAWHMGHRIREAFASTMSEKFSGPVEADETFLGGLEGNKHKNKKLRAGRGAVGKAAIAGLRDRKTGKVIVQMVRATDGPTLKGFVEGHTSRRAMVYTDEASAYKGMLRDHEAVRHGVSEYVRGQAHTNGMESFWAALKRGYDGVYHSMSRQHLPRYIREFAGRHNSRGKDTADQMVVLAKGTVGKQLPYKELTRKYSKLSAD